MVQVKCNFFSFFFKHPLQYVRLQTVVIKDAALVRFPSEEWQERNSSVNLSQGHKGLICLKIDTIDFSTFKYDEFCSEKIGTKWYFLCSSSLFVNFDITCLQDS